VKSTEAAAEAANRLLPQPRIITTAGSRQRKIVRKYVKNDRGLAGLQTRKATAAVAATPPPEPPTPVPVAMSSPPGRSVARRLGKKADAELLLKGPTGVRLSNGIREKTAAAAVPVPVSPAASPRTPMSRLENPYSKQFNTSSSRRKRQASSTDDCSSSDTGGGGQSPAVMSSSGGKSPAVLSSGGGKSPTVSSSGGKSPAVLSGDGTPNLSPEAKKARKEISGVTPIRTSTERYRMCVLYLSVCVL
jgi:hypothetical protein